MTQRRDRPMRLLCRLALALLAGSLALLAGCAAQQREAIGTLGTSGAGVYVNRAPAQSGRIIYSGEEVSTGPGVSAIVDFGGGHFVQLDENTDPLFSWRLVDQVRCVFVQMFSGQAYADASPFCLATAAVEVVSGSKLNIWLLPQASVVSVLEGHMTPRQPPGRTVEAGEELTAESGGALHVRRLSPTELAERAAWRARYRFTGWCNDGLFGARRADRESCNPRDFTFSEPTRDAPTPVPWHFGPRLQPRPQPQRPRSYE